MVMRRSGARPNTVVMDPDAWNVFKADDGVQSRLDTRRVNDARLNMAGPRIGGTLMGTIGGPPGAVLRNPGTYSEGSAMFVKTVDRHRPNDIYIRADRVCGLKDWPGIGDAPSDAEVFLLGAPETLMVGERSHLMERITATAGASARG